MFRGMLAKKGVAKRFATLLYDGATPKFRHLALSLNFYRKVEGEGDLVNSIVLGQGKPLIYSEDALDAVTGGDDYEFEDDDEIEEREYEGDKYRATIFSNKDLKIVMQETAMNDFSSITLLSPVSHHCFEWLGKGDYSVKNIRGMDFFVSEFPGEQDFPSPPERRIRKVDDRSFNELIKNMEDINVDDKNVHVPKALKSREEAAEVLKTMGIYIPQVHDVLFPSTSSEGTEGFVQRMMKNFSLFGGVEGIRDAVMKRGRSRFHLPGFQGVVDDNKLKAEVEAVFGENGHYLFTGSVRLSESSYKQTMRSIKRVYNHTGHEGRAKLLFIIATLIDTVPHPNSDGWYIDNVNQIIEELESKIEEEEVLILPVNPRKFEEELYTEKDPFA